MRTRKVRKDTQVLTLSRRGYTLGGSYAGVISSIRDEVATEFHVEPEDVVASTYLVARKYILVDAYVGATKIGRYLLVRPFRG